jgi:hypothetical protein
VTRGDWCERCRRGCQDSACEAPASCSDLADAAREAYLRGVREGLRCAEDLDAMPGVEVPTDRSLEEAIEDATDMYGHGLGIVRFLLWVSAGRAA